MRPAALNPRGQRRLSTASTMTYNAAVALHATDPVEWETIRRDLRKEGMTTSIGLQQVLLRNTLKPSRVAFGDESKHEDDDNNGNEDGDTNNAGREMSNKLAIHSADRVVRRLLQSDRDELLMRGSMSCCSLPSRLTPKPNIGLQRSSSIPSKTPTRSGGLSRSKSIGSTGFKSTRKPSMVMVDLRQNSNSSRSLSSSMSDASRGEIESNGSSLRSIFSSMSNESFRELGCKSSPKSAKPMSDYLTMDSVKQNSNLSVSSLYNDNIYNQLEPMPTNKSKNRLYEVLGTVSSTLVSTLEGELEMIECQ